MAQTLTSKLKLAKHDTGDLNWGADANANMDALDAHAQQALLRPPRTLAATLGSGAVGANLLGNTTYFYKVTAINAVGETTEGQIPTLVEGQVTQPATPLPVILQWETVSGATGYKIYKATASGGEQFLAQVSGGAVSTYTDTGNTATTTATVPVSNTARTSVTQIVAGSNVTVSPPDGTGAVTVNATVQTPPAASDTVQGDTKLSVAPAVAGSPIAVGVNDPSVTNSRAPSGAASGDLSGTYPNPSVAKVNGTSVPASPSAGQVLTATGPTAAAWQTPAGGGGYATVVVAAPTGVAATDTANIQNAINSIGSGTVILREGLYAVNAKITLKSRITIKGQGKGEFGSGAPTTIKCDNSMGDTPLFDVDNLQNLKDVALEDFSIDFNGFSRAARSGSYDIRMMATRARFERIAVANTSGTGPAIYIQPADITEQDSPVVTDCVFVQGKACAGGVGDFAAAFTIGGKVTNCTFIGETATGGFQSALASFLPATSVVGCVFRTNKDYTTGVQGATVGLSTAASNGRSGMLIAGCVFIQESGTATRAIQVVNDGSGSVTITGNYSATGTSVGSVSVRNAGGTGSVMIVGNSGFSSYGEFGGGSQVANDNQTFNGVAVDPTAPSTGQVLTATSPTGAAWQTPAAASTPGYPSVLGTGADGAAVIAANTALPSTNNFGPQANVAIKNYSSLTINSGAILSLAAGVNGMIIRCTGTVTINGTLDVSGQGAVSPSSGGTPGSPGGEVIGGGTPSPVLFPQLFGAATSGDVFNGNAGGPAIISGAGGAGSSGNSPASSHTPGNGGPAPSSMVVAFLKALAAYAYSMGVFLTGGSGGGNGNGGLLGGNGGGFVYIFAANIVIGSTGLIKANGSDGTTSGPVGLAGCGGGGGGIIVLAYQALTNNGAVQANGGAGGGVDSVAGPAAGGTNTTIGGQPTAGTTMPSTTGYPSGGISQFAASGGGGSGGIIVGIQL